MPKMSPHDTTRRAFVAGLAAAAPVAAMASLPAVAAAEPDPIFAAIAAHERASAAYSEALLKRDDAEENKISDPEIIEANFEAVELAAEADTEAAIALVSTIPTTIAGALALLKYSASGEGRYGCEWPHLTDDEDPGCEHAKPWDWFLHRTLIRSLAAA